MAKPRKKLTPAQKRARRERKRKFKMIFINGKQRWVRKPETIGGLPIEEFIARNAGPIDFHEMEMWEHMNADFDNTHDDQDHA